MKTGIELLESYAKDGEQEAFAEFTRRYVKLVFWVANRRLGDASAAEEAAHLVFIRVARSQPRFASEGKLVAWLHRTATNVAIDLWRTESRRRAREKEAGIMQSDFTGVDLESLARNLDEAIDALTESERQAILLRFFAGRRMSEVGAALGVSEDAAKMRVSRAVQALRRRLGGAGVACGEAALFAFLAECSLQAAPPELADKLGGLSRDVVRRAGFARSNRMALIGGGAALLLTMAIFVAPDQSQPLSQATEEATRPESREGAEAITARSAVKPTLAPRLTLSLVNEETGEAVPAPLIHSAYFFGERSSEGESTFHESDARGMVEIGEARQPNPTSLTVRIAQEGYVPISIFWAGTKIPREHTMKLDAARTFSGTVLDEEGERVPGVLIRVKSPNSPANGGTLAFHQSEAAIMSDASGEWRLPFIPKWWSSAEMFLMKEGFALTVVSIPTRAENPETANMVIRRGWTLEGKVLDDAGHPIAFATVHEVRPRMDWNYSFPENVVASGRDGSFIFQKMLPTALDQNIRLEARATGFATQIREVILKSNTNVMFAMSTTQLFRGRVVDEAGVPQPNVSIVATGRKFSYREYEWSTQSDAEGKFEWTAAPAETAYELRAPHYYKDGTWSWRIESPLRLVLKADGSEHIIRLNPEPKP